MIPLPLALGDPPTEYEAVAAGAAAPAPSVAVSADTVLAGPEYDQLAAKLAAQLLAAQPCGGMTSGLVEAAIAKCLSETPDYETETLDRAAWCIVLTLCPDLRETMPGVPELVDQLAKTLRDTTARLRGPRVPRPTGPVRTPWKRAPRSREPMGPIYCNGKYRGQVPLYWSYAELLAWAKKNCFPPERKGKPAGPPVGGTITEGRRSPGLFDFNHPIDEGVRPGKRDPRTGKWSFTDGWKPSMQPGDTGLPKGWTGMNKLGEKQWGTANWLGMKCTDPGASLTCVNGATGKETIWHVTGRTFTKAEKDTFVREQCRDRCGDAPKGRGAPGDAKTKRIRAQPANLAVRHALKCNAGPLPLAPKEWKWKPLPDIPQQPAAEATPPACRPDTILGRDCGYFGSGWWIIAPRSGQQGIELVAAPNTCGAPVPSVPCQPSPL